MDGETGERPSKIDRLFDSIDRGLGLEKPVIAEIIYQYPRQGEPVLWIDLLTKEKPFKPWYYSLSLSVKPEDRVTIPQSNTRSVIHFLPPEAKQAYGRNGSRDFWLADESFRGKRVSIARRNIAAFTDLLNAIKNGELKETEYIIGQTNSVMANFAQSLGFKRCWEEGYNPPDLTRPMVNENLEYKIGVSVAELVEMYGLKTQTPTKESVLAVIRRNKAGNRNVQKTV